jgi:hypothetical protein
LFGVKLVVSNLLELVTTHVIMFELCILSDILKLLSFAVVLTVISQE